MADLRLYNKLKAAADPFAYERYRKERIAALREEAASTRIRASSLKKKVVKRGDLRTPALEAAAADSRFGDLLTDPAFSIDRGSETFKRLNPMGVRTPKVLFLLLLFFPASSFLRAVCRLKNRSSISRKYSFQRNKTRRRKKRHQG